MVNRRLFLITAARAVAAQDNSKLESVRAGLAARGTRALLIQKSGRVVFEWYASGVSAATKHGTASMAKALVGGTSLMIAMADGRIRADDYAAKFIPAWRDDPRKSKITIRHLATHTSGIEDSSVEGVPHNQEPGWKGQFWRRDPDPFSVSIHDAPVIFEPGRGNQYSNPGMAALAYAVTASLRGAPQPDILSALRERVMRPLGIPDSDWSIGYGRPYSFDGLDLYATWGGGAFTPRAAAKVAGWMMREGKALVKYARMPLPDRKAEPYAPGSGLCWYSNFDGVWPAVPRDAFAGAGAGHQAVLAIPSLETIVVRNGAALAPQGKASFWTPLYEHVFEPVMAALDRVHR